jgi:hypothetical protein
VLPFDPTAASLVSNRSIVCVNLSAINRRLYPILQPSQLQVSFSITNPSVWLLTLNEAQIRDLVEASPSLNWVGSTFGGTISSIGSPGATPAVPTAEPTSSPIGMIVGVCLGSVAFVFATSLVVFYKRSAKAQTIIQNPVAKAHEWPSTNEDDRIKFAPEMIRDRIHV